MAKGLAKKLAIVGLAGLLSACGNSRTEYSSLKTEEAIVHKRYQSSFTSILPCGKSFMIVSHPARYTTDFSGKISLESDSKEVYDRFEEGATASVSYVECYKVYLKDLDKDGKKEETGRVLDDYEFVDAQPRK